MRKGGREGGGGDSQQELPGLTVRQDVLAHREQESLGVEKHQCLNHGKEGTAPTALTGNLGFTLPLRCAIIAFPGPVHPWNLNS